MNNTHFLIILDYAEHYVVICQLPRLTPESIWDKIQETWIQQFGKPNCGKWDPFSTHKSIKMEGILEDN